MSQSQLEITMGRSVLPGLSVLAALPRLFTRGAGFYVDTHDIYLSSNVNTRGWAFS